MRKAVISNPILIENSYSKSTEELCKLVGNNTGNLVFRLAVSNQVGKNSKIIPWGSSPEFINENFDVAFLPCANQFGDHAYEESRRKLISKLDIPVVAIGLGAQSSVENSIPDVPKETVQWVKEISLRKKDNSPNIFVRGEYTKKVLAHYGIEDGVEALGCPSLYLNLQKQLGQNIQEKLNQGIFKIGVAAGNPHSQTLNGIERKLIALAKKTSGSYIVQHPPKLIKLARGDKFEDQAWDSLIEKFTGLNTNSTLFSSNNGFNITTFFNVLSWMEELSHHDFIIGTRIHGTLLALQAGTPALCITHDTRTKELCDLMMVPNISAAEFEAKSLKAVNINEFIEFDPEAFDANREKLYSRYSKLMSNYYVSLPSFI